MLCRSPLKVICPKWPIGIPPFLLLWGLCLRCVCSVIPSILWLSFHGDYSPTAHAAPSLTLLVLRGSLIRYDQAQVYHHQPWSRVLLDPIYHIFYPGDYTLWVLPWGLQLGWFPLRTGWALEPHSVTLVVARTVGQSVVMSFHPVTGQLQVLVGIIVDVM
jgi:hypothetical protein